jgi:hypothetical protein
MDHKLSSRFGSDITCGYGQTNNNKQHVHFEDARFIGLYHLSLLGVSSFYISQCHSNWTSVAAASARFMLTGPSVIVSSALWLFYYSSHSAKALGHP